MAFQDRTLQITIDDVREVGLIVTEGTLINHPAAGVNVNLPHFYG